MHKEIIFAAKDPGGFNALLPIIKKIGGKVFLDGESRNLALQNKLEFTDGSRLTQKQVEKIISIFKPKIIVTGTSLGINSLDKKFIRASKKYKIPVVAILDFWVNYIERFEKAIPDKILVMDEIAKEEMIVLGIPKNKIIATGNPLFDSFKKPKKKGQLIVFFSQPFSEYGYRLGLNESKIFGEITKALEELKIKLPIKIKLHPREKKQNKFNKIIEKSNLDIKISNEPVEKLIKQARLVIGMNSMTLFQSCMVGKKVLSYQPHLNEPDPLITNRLGLSEAVYFKKDLKRAIRKILTFKQRKTAKYKLPKNVTTRIINILHRLY